MGGIPSLLAGAGRLALGAGKEIGKDMIGDALGGVAGDAFNMLLPTSRGSSNTGGSFGSALSGLMSKRSSKAGK